MLSRFLDAFITFPKWFQYGLCPVAYVVVGIFISHLYSWKMAKITKMGCGAFTPRDSWSERRCPVDELCDNHGNWRVFYSIMMPTSVIAWPATVSVNMAIVILFNVATGLYKSFKWLWTLPEKTVNRKWQKLDQLVELLNNKYKNQARIEIKESDAKKGLLIFQILYKDKILVGGYKNEKGFFVHPRPIREDDVPASSHSDVVAVHFPEVQGAYYKILEILGNP